jgi:RHS repeat-associated protein
VLTIAIQVSSAVTTSGRHPWQLQISTPGGTKTVTGYSFVDVQDTSHYGAGWTFSGTDQLIAVAADGANGLPAGVLREYGTGEWRFYTDTGGSTYSSPAGDNGTLSKTGNTYTYSTPDGQSWTFNASGFETQWTSADGKETMQFAYDGSNKLTAVTSIDGTTATFNYDGTTNLLTTVSESGGRTVSLAYDSSTNPNLTSITNPDGGTHTFAYDTSNHLTSETFGGTQNNWAYTSYGTLGTFTWGSLTGPGGASNPSTTTVVAADTQGLAGVYANTVTASTTDGNGRLTGYQLDSQGRTLARTNPDGGTMSYAYNSNGFLTTQTDELGRTTTYALDSKGYVTQTTLPDGNTTPAAYQSNFHAMTTSTDERGNTTTFQYDSAGHLTATINALGQTTTDSYDSTTGLLTAETDANGHATNYYYDTNRRITKVTDGNSHSTTTTYDGNGNVQTTVDARGYTTTYSDDAMGRTTATTDANGNVTSQTWDAAGEALVSTDAKGTQGSVVYDGFKRGLVSSSVEAIGTAVQRTTLDSYDNAGQETGSRDANGWWTTNGRDAVGRETSTTDARGAIHLTQYDLAGEVTSTRDALGDLTQDFYNLRGWLTKTIDATGAVSTFQYDQAGDKTAEIDPLGHTVTFQYDKLDRVTTETDATGKTSTTAYDNAGNVLSETDRSGHTVSYGYDNAEQRTTTIDAYGTSHAETLTTAYDQDNNVTQQTDGNGHSVNYAYDKADRQTSVTDANSHTTTSSLDQNGNATQVTDATGKNVNYSFDALNRQVSMTDANSHVTTTIDDANGQAVGSIDANGNLKQTAFDSTGEVVGSLDGDGNYTRQQYDAEGRLVAYTDPVGNQTNYYYDRDGREVLRTDPAGAKTTTAYDSDGNKTSVTDRDGRQTTFAYDNDNRLIGEKWYNSSGTLTNTQTFAYDNVGNLTSAADTNGTVTRGYDELNRVTSQTDVFGNTTTYNYDNADRLTQMTDSKGGTTTYQYDNGDRLTSVRFGGSGQTQARIDLGYDNRNELTSQTRYADVAGTLARGSTAYVYDDGGRVTAITNTNGSGATLSYYDYSYGSGDRVTQETWQSTTSTTTLSGTHTYGYDNADQLTSADGTNYSYDSNGNRNSAGYTTGSANRMTNDGTYSYGYDAEGNLTSKVAGGANPDTWAFTYNQNNQLVSVTEKSNGTTVNFSVTYTYDALGERVQQDEWSSGTGLVTTRLDYDISGRVWAQADGSNNVQARDLWGPGQTQLLAEINVGAGTRAFALADRLGSVRDVADGSASYVSDHVEFGAFGTVATESNTTAGINNLYTGLWQDRTSGIVFADQRTLLVTTGQWMQEDPIDVMAGDPNFRRYSGNDATNETDPSGQLPKDFKLKITKVKGKPSMELLYNDKKVAHYDAYGVGVRFVFEFLSDLKDKPGDKDVSLNAVKSKLGIDHFNFYQINTRYTGKVPLKDWGGHVHGTPHVDPPLGGTEGRRADYFPWYWDEGKVNEYLDPVYNVDKHTYKNLIRLDDAPRDTSGDVEMSFKTWVVGVDKAGNLVTFLGGVEWTWKNNTRRDGYGYLDEASIKYFTEDPTNEEYDWLIRDVSRADYTRTKPQLIPVLPRETMKGTATIPADAPKAK